MRPRGGLRPGIALPGGLGVAGVIVFLLLQVLSSSSGAGGAFAVDDPFGES